MVLLILLDSAVVILKLTLTSLSFFCSVVSVLVLDCVCSGLSVCVSGCFSTLKSGLNFGLVLDCVSSGLSLLVSGCFSTLFSGLVLDCVSSGLSVRVSGCFSALSSGLSCSFFCVFYGLVLLVLDCVFLL